MMHFGNWLKDLWYWWKKRLLIIELSDSDDDFYLLTLNSDVTDTAETTAEDETAYNPNVVNKSLRNDEFADISQKKRL